MLANEKTLFNPWESARNQLTKDLSEGGFSTECTYKDINDSCFSKAKNLFEFLNELNGLDDETPLVLFKNNHYSLTVIKESENKIYLNLFPTAFYSDPIQSHTKDLQEREIIVKYVNFVRLLLSE